MTKMYNGYTVGYLYGLGFNAAEISTCSPSCPAGLTGHCSSTGTAVCCGAGYTYRDGKTTDAACEACAAGSYSSSGATCDACGDGLFSAAGASTCAPCAAGYYCVGGTQNACAVGTYSYAGASTCAKCSDGLYFNASLSTCTQCTAGSFCVNGIQTQCALGVPAPFCAACSVSNTYAPAAGASACLKCPTYALASLDGKGCLCAPGTYWQQSPPACVPCARDSVAPGWGTVRNCTKCYFGIT